MPGCLASPSSWDDKWPTVGVKTFDKEILLHFGEALIFGGPEAAGKAMGGCGPRVGWWDQPQTQHAKAMPERTHQGRVGWGKKYRFKRQ
jgi:hypothetical protein